MTINVIRTNISKESINNIYATYHFINLYLVTTTADNICPTILIQDYYK